MRRDRSIGIVPAVVIGVGLGMWARSATGQGLADPGSLGGYGATSSGVTVGMGGRGPMIIPYSGTFEGFMPGRMGGGSSLSFRTRTGATTGMSTRGFRLSPLSGGMSGMGGGTLLGGIRRMPRGPGMGVMPPRIGYPFRQPPSLIAPATAGMGMSM